jgi:hypothetical protein
MGDKQKTNLKTVPEIGPYCSSTVFPPDYIVYNVFKSWLITHTSYAPYNRFYSVVSSTIYYIYSFWKLGGYHRVGDNLGIGYVFRVTGLENN